MGAKKSRPHVAPPPPVQIPDSKNIMLLQREAELKQIQREDLERRSRMPQGAPPPEAPPAPIPEPFPEGPLNIHYCCRCGEVIGATSAYVPQPATGGSDKFQVKHDQKGCKEFQVTWPAS